jgi:hypothetical protein
LERRSPGGEVGAYFARSGDGRRLVFKWSEDPRWSTELCSVVERVERLRSKGYLAPRHYQPVFFEGGVAVFQDVVAGEWSDDVDAELVETVLALNDMQAGEALTAGRWTEYLVSTLDGGAYGQLLGETLRTHSSRTRSVLEWIGEVGEHVPVVTAADVVHLDFHHRNMLRVGDRLSAVVDWEGCTSGDRAFDLVTFCFGLGRARAALGVEERVWSRAEELAPAAHLRVYVAHMALRTLDWAIRHHSAAEVDRVLEVIALCRSRLP